MNEHLASDRVDDEELRLYRDGRMGLGEELRLLRRLHETEGTLERVTRPIPEPGADELATRERRRERLLELRAQFARDEEGPSWRELVRVKLRALRDAFSQLGTSPLAANRTKGDSDSEGGTPRLPEGSLEFADGTPYTATLRVGSKPTRLEVRVFDEEKNPAPDVALQLEPSGFATASAETDSDGRAVFRLLVGRDWFEDLTDEELEGTFALRLARR